MNRHIYSSAICLMLASFAVQAADPAAASGTDKAVVQPADNTQGAVQYDSATAAPAPDGAKAGMQVAPDNTKVNQRDRSSAALTPGDQSNAKEDIELTRTLRKSIMKENLSTYAKNIKIITRSSEMTLRGVVKSVDEKQKIAELAKSIQGIKKLDNQLEVK